MSVIGSNILAGASGQGGGYNLTKSLRFRSSASAYLNRTLTTPTSAKAWTFSAWIKRGKLGSGQSIFISTLGGAGVPQASSYFTSSDTIQIYDYTGSAYTFDLTTSQVFRDASAWYHLVFVYDSANATSSNRVRLYVNGVQITAFSSASYPTQNADCAAFNRAYTHYLSQGNAQYFDGYMAEINFIDGQALDASSFGETSTTTGVWIPKKYTGTYGTNGFYLPFTDTTSTSTLGTDFSGNSNTWTVNNISLTSGSTYDSMTDVPTLTSATTANYCVLNPLDKSSTNTLSNGNLRYAITEGQQGMGRATFGLPSTGKWYCEATKLSGGNLDAGIATRTASLSLYLGEDANGWGYFSADGKVYNNNASIATGATLADGDVLGIAFNSDTGTLQFYKNGSLQTTTTGFTPSTVQYFFAAGSFGGDGDFNFGQQPFAYTPPTGFVALNTFNLPTPTIGATASTTANKYFNANLYTGNAGSNTISGVGFQPDFIWAKSRSNGAAYHGLWDVVRGSNNLLYSNGTDAETNAGNLNMSPNADGFSINGGNSSFNLNTSSQVAWNWKANGTGVTNTAGSIISSVSANTTAGFSIVTFTAPSSGQFTVGHGLGVTPNMVIVKDRTSGSTTWVVYHSSLGVNNTDYLVLNTTAAEASFSTMWGSGGMTSSTCGFTVGGSTYANDNHVAYCFAQVAGYSAFGSYTGNGDPNGTFVYLGFRPKFVLYKSSTAASVGDWRIHDTSRSSYNAAQLELYAQSSGSEPTSSNAQADILSNGFKLRGVSGNTSWNESGVTYIYMAFAEHPFKYANAR